MKVIAVIPARFNASRFPGKLLQLLGDKPVILHVYDNTVSTGLFDSVYVVTDSLLIYNEIVSAGGSAIMSKKVHESGSDRIAEMVADMDVDVVVNIQGDEPFIQKEALENLILSFNNPSVVVASLMRKIKREDAASPNLVKVVVDKNNDALYFSRSLIPFERTESPTVFLHIGIYCYKKEVLLSFTQQAPSELERTECLEQLRYLEAGVKIKMVETNYQSVSIDTPEDLPIAKALLISGLYDKSN